MAGRAGIKNNPACDACGGQCETEYDIATDSYLCIDCKNYCY
jgi:hypothetical protein